VRVGIKGINLQVAIEYTRYFIRIAVTIIIENSLIDNFDLTSMYFTKNENKFYKQENSLGYKIYIYI